MLIKSGYIIAAYSACEKTTVSQTCAPGSRDLCLGLSSDLLFQQITSMTSPNCALDSRLGQTRLNTFIASNGAVRSICLDRDDHGVPVLSCIHE